MYLIIHTFEAFERQMIWTWEYGQRNVLGDLREQDF